MEPRVACTRSLPGSTGSPPGQAHAAQQSGIEKRRTKEGGSHEAAWHHTPSCWQQRVLAVAGRARRAGREPEAGIGRARRRGGPPPPGGWTREANVAQHRGLDRTRRGRGVGDPRRHTALMALRGDCRHREHGRSSPTLRPLERRHDPLTGKAEARTRAGPIGPARRSPAASGSAGTAHDPAEPGGWFLPSPRTSGPGITSSTDEGGDHVDHEAVP